MFQIWLTSLLAMIKAAASNGIALYATLLFVISVIWFITETKATPENTRVDLALILAVDVSYSVDNSEYHLQNQGLARAFASREVIASIRQCPWGRIAVMFVQWSGRRLQSTVVPWTIVSDEATAYRVARAISAAPRQSAGQTSISALIDFALFQFLRAPITTFRYVIDISTDGVNNDGERPRFPRERAIAAGVTINGLTILNDVNNLDVYFRQYIAAGPNNFVMKADDYEDYRTAIKRKLLKEIECLVLV